MWLVRLDESRSHKNPVSWDLVLTVSREREQVRSASDLTLSVYKLFPKGRRGLSYVMDEFDSSSSF